MQQMAQRIYTITYECGKSYIGEIGRPLAVQLREQTHSERRFSRKIKISLTCLCRAYVGWDEARILKIECNSRHRTYNESTHMACLTNPISQLSLDISSIWISLISNEVSNSQGRSV
jgi:hypothetical protein